MHGCEVTVSVNDYSVGVSALHEPGREDFHMKHTGMLVVSLRGVILDFGLA